MEVDDPIKSSWERHEILYWLHWKIPSILGIKSYSFKAVFDNISVLSVFELYVAYRNLPGDVFKHVNFESILCFQVGISFANLKREKYNCLKEDKKLIPTDLVDMSTAQVQSF